MSDSQATYQDADLLLKLYDLRREPVMREARTFIVQFTPQSADDILKIMRAWGAKEGAYIRQVSGYWSMVASLVNHGVLNEALVYENCAEMYLLYAKFKPFLASIREGMGAPDYLKKPPQNRRPLAEIFPDVGIVAAQQLGCGAFEDDLVVAENHERRVRVAC